MRRDFVHQRSHNGGHQALAARLTPAVSSLAIGNSVNTPSASPTSSSDPLTTDPFPTPTVSAAKTTDTSTPSSSAALSLSSVSASSSSASASALSSSSASSSSSAAHAVSSTGSASLVAASTAATHAPVVVSTQGDTTFSFSPTSSLSPSTTSSTSNSSGTNTGVIVGGIAGALAGIAILGFLLMWCIRRQQDRDIDDFDAQAFKRQSAVLVDDPVNFPRSYNARPQTMVEHHNASPALAAQAGFGQNFYGNYGGYGQQAPHAPPEMAQPAGPVPPQGYGAAQMGYPGYNDPPQQLARQPSNAEYLTRQPNSAAGYTPPAPPPSSFDPNAHYIDLNRSSISPYQAAQYADISRRLGTNNPNGQAPRESLAIPDDPLPSPFDDPVQPSHAAPHAPQTQGNATNLHQRPNTVYEDGDAYGGI